MFTRSLAIFIIKCNAKTQNQCKVMAKSIDAAAAAARLTCWLEAKQ
jgi:hypothetical protein